MVGRVRPVPVVMLGMRQACRGATKRQDMHPIIDRAALSPNVSRLVVKVGGRVVEGSATHVLDLAASGHEICVVHGAGPQISSEMRRLGLPVEFVGGRRVTTAAGLDVVRESFAAVSASLCRAIGPRAAPRCRLLQLTRPSHRARRD